MSGHTPGPWRVDDRTVYALDFIDGGTRNRFSCRVEGYFDRRDGAAESDANARLITAAPDLLAALKELLAAGNFAVESDDDVAIMLRLGQATDAARAAIAKAEGR